MCRDDEATYNNSHTLQRLKQNKEMGRLYKKACWESLLKNIEAPRCRL